MARFSIGIVNFEKNLHTHCFEEVARGFADALRVLGHDVVPPYDAKPGRLVIFGGNNLKTDDRFPPDAIVYNAEQVAALRNATWLMQNVKQFTKHVIIDYSWLNVGALRELGVEKPVFCPVGFMPSMVSEHMVEPIAEDIDVLFVGSVNPRRRVILEAIAASGLRLVPLFGVYGADRDRIIARAKVVLNLHFYERPIFEIFRVSHLLANRKAVVSEDGGFDPELETFAERATCYVGRDRIVDACRELVGNDQARRDLAERGAAVFRTIDFVENVRRALAEAV